MRFRFSELMVDGLFCIEVSTYFCSFFFIGALFLVPVTWLHNMQFAWGYSAIKSAFWKGYYVQLLFILKPSSNNCTISNLVLSVNYERCVYPTLIFKYLQKECWLVPEYQGCMISKPVGKEIHYLNKRMDISRRIRIFFSLHDFVCLQILCDIFTEEKKTWYRWPNSGREKIRFSLYLIFQIFMPVLLSVYDYSDIIIIKVMDTGCFWSEWLDKLNGNVSKMCLLCLGLKSYEVMGWVVIEILVGLMVSKWKRTGFFK